MIHFFNPGHEYALLNQSPYYTYPSNIVKLQQELASVAIWYANDGDIVIGFEELTDSFEEYTKGICKNVHYIPLSEIEAKKNLLKNQVISLWGISPQAIHFFEELNKQYELDLVIPQWNNQFVELGSRKKALECLSFLVKENQQIQENTLPQIQTSLESIEKLVNTTSHKLLAKAPYSSSGRGLLWLPLGELTRTERQILNGILKKQSYVSIEKALNKKLDFAMEFEINSQNVEFIGYSLFNTNEKGAYQSNYIGRQENIVKQLEEFIDSAFLKKIKTDLIQFLTTHYQPLYEGYIGVDMMIYEETGLFHLQPCIEINMRNNMGILSLNFSEKYLSPNSRGNLYIEFSSKEDIFQKHINDMEQYPLATKDGKIRTGYLPLCPVNCSSSYRAYIIGGLTNDL